MPYETNIEVFPDHVRTDVTGVRITGEVVSNSDLLGQEMVRACSENSIHRILLVLHLTGRLSSIDAYEMVLNSEQYGWSRDMKMAIVDMNEESLQDSEFVETVAVTRAYPVSVFDNEEEARDWLLG